MQSRYGGFPKSRASALLSLPLTLPFEIFEILDHQCRRLLRYSWLIGREAPKREKICELATLLARLCNEAFVDLLNRV